MITIDVIIHDAACNVLRSTMQDQTKTVIGRLEEVSLIFKVLSHIAENQVERCKVGPEFDIESAVAKLIELEYV